MSILRGEVCSGRGKATRRLEPLSALLAPLLGGSPVPGSLNLITRQPVVLNPRAAAWGDGRLFWKIELNGLPCLAYRYSRCPLHVIEVVAAEHLRDRFFLKDGDAVEISIAPEMIAPTSPLRSLCWALIWRGREEAYFSDDAYVHRAQKFLRPVTRLTYQPMR